MYECLVDALPSDGGEGDGGRAAPNQNNQPRRPLVRHLLRVVERVRDRPVPALSINHLVRSFHVGTTDCLRQNLTWSEFSGKMFVVSGWVVQWAVTANYQFAVSSKVESFQFEFVEVLVSARIW